MTAPHDYQSHSPSNFDSGSLYHLSSKEQQEILEVSSIIALMGEYAKIHLGTEPPLNNVNIDDTTSEELAYILMRMNQDAHKFINFNEINHKGETQNAKARRILNGLVTRLMIEEGLDNEINSSKINISQASQKNSKNKKPNKQLVKKTKPPKQPISSFLAFYRHKRSEMAKKHPELTFGQPFVDEANKDRIRFADEQEKYRELQAKKSKLKTNQDEEYNDKDIKKLKPVKENKKIKKYTAENTFITSTASLETVEAENNSNCQDNRLSHGNSERMNLNEPMVRTSSDHMPINLMSLDLEEFFFQNVKTNTPITSKLYSTSSLDSGRSFEHSDNPDRLDLPPAPTGKRNAISINRSFKRSKRDSMTEEQRRELQEKNRIAALKCRKRKKEYVATLKDSIETLEAENLLLEERIKMLESILENS
ncbi:hypothetical protein O9G_002094 [Rozella allomycis CSF55]|uniref:BZIP domain-containing protein n=1 Tax=Rozella allomycis (strain CSF55) TaxID=988480 RepID=A0A075B573_ROZAC|nr:hypothetical protein O9G_002094 [Rozella allomycis CSF55]|eukprot:EPZ36813.1 hypothetical protein O9G_002094 [Rozella allomycis CSF55]